MIQVEIKTIEEKAPKVVQDRIRGGKTSINMECGKNREKERKKKRNSYTAPSLSENASCDNLMAFFNVTNSEMSDVE